MAYFQPSLSPVKAQRWLARLDREEAETGRFTYKHVRALARLLSFDGESGCFPARETVALRENIDVKTFDASVSRAVEAGMLEVQERYRWAVINGRRLKVRASNAYRFMLPRDPMPRLKRAREWVKDWWRRHRARRRPESNVCSVPIIEDKSLSSVPEGPAETSVPSSVTQEMAREPAPTPIPLSAAQLALNAVEASALPAQHKVGVRNATVQTIRMALLPQKEPPKVIAAEAADVGASLQRRRDEVERQQKEAWQARQGDLLGRIANSVAATWAASVDVQRAQAEARVAANITARRAAVTAMRPRGSG